MKNRNEILPQPKEKKWYNWIMVQKHKFRNHKFKKEEDKKEWEKIIKEFKIEEDRKILNTVSYKEKCNQYRDFLLRKNIPFPNRKSEDEEEKYWYGWVTNQRYNYENRKYRTIEELGYSILVIWDYDIKEQGIEKIVNKCLFFLKT